MTTTRRTAATILSLALILSPAWGHLRSPKVPDGKIMTSTGRIVKINQKTGCFWLTYEEAYKVKAEDKNDKEKFCPR